MSADESIVDMAPGTMRLTDLTTKVVVLQPTPSEDPRDPLNWSRTRKAVNFGLVLFYVLMTFVLVDIFGVGYNGYVETLGMTFDDYNAISASSYAGLAVGCILFIPLVYKFGRRPIYLISLVVQLATAIWAAKADSIVEWFPLSVVQGLGGAISETIVQITIADLFFVHQYATMNGLFLLFQSTGAFLGPVAAGYVIVGQGLQWQWWWCAIFLALSLVLVFFFFEETAYAPVLEGQSTNQGADSQHIDEESGGTKTKLRLTKTTSPAVVGHGHDTTWANRLRLYTKSQDSVGHHVWQPFVLLARIPAIVYTALTYGILLSNFAAIASVSSAWLYYPPYNFGAIGVGLFSIAPFIGTLVAGVLVAPLSDRLAVRLATRNSGIYEAEMRLWPAIPFSIIACGGMLMFGIGIAQGRAWLLLAFGAALFGLGFVSCADIALSYLTDSYQNLVGDAVVGVIFVRNVISVIILFTLTPWINAVGLQNMFISFSFITLAITLGGPILLLIFGKSCRRSTAKLVERYSLQQHSPRGR